MDNPTRERFRAKVEKTESCWNWTGTISTKGYGRFSVRKTTYQAHRVSWEEVNGAIPAGLLIDHMCHNRRCVNPSHLRMVTNKQNMENRRGAMCNSKSGILGVSWSKITSKWAVYVKHNGKVVGGGYYVDIADAEAAAIALRKKLFTHNDLDRVAS